MMTAPLDVTEGNRKRKQLLEQLARQAGLQRGQGPARPVFGGGRPFFAFSNLPAAPRPQLTRPFPIPPGLAKLLGPGGHGTPGDGEYSRAPGLPAHEQHIFGGGPSTVNSPSPPGPPAPGAPTGGVPADPTLASSSPAASSSAGPSATLEMARSGDLHRHMYSSTGDQPVPTADILAGGLIPLGGGIYFNPATGEFHGEQIAAAGDAIRASQALGGRQLIA